MAIIICTKNVTIVSILAISILQYIKALNGNESLLRCETDDVINSLGIPSNGLSLYNNDVTVMRGYLDIRRNKILRSLMNPLSDLSEKISTSMSMIESKQEDYHMIQQMKFNIKSLEAQIISMRFKFLFDSKDFKKDYRLRLVERQRVKISYLEAQFSNLYAKLAYYAPIQESIPTNTPLLGNLEFKIGLDEGIVAFVLEKRIEYLTNLIRKVTVLLKSDNSKSNEFMERSINQFLVRTGINFSSSIGNSDSRISMIEEIQRNSRSISSLEELLDNMASILSRQILIDGKSC